jgi:predicted RNase H-like HicB family nuclease
MTVAALGDRWRYEISEESTGTAPSTDSVGYARSFASLLAGLSSDQYMLKRPLFVILEWDEDQWLATHPDLGVFGVGETRRDAVNDFQLMLVEYYEDLRESEEILAPHLQMQLYALSNLISEAE